MRHRAILVDLGLVAIAALDGVLGLYTSGATELILTLVGAAGLFLRRRFPLVAVALALPALLLTGGPIASVIALATVATRVSSTTALAVASVVTFLGLTLSWDVIESINDLVLAVVYGTMTSGGAVAIGRLRRSQTRLAASLAELERAREEETRLAAREAVAEERAHLAREMHDVVSHQVSLITVQAGALMVRSEDPEVVDTADTIRVLAAATLTELRQMLLVLRADEPEAAPLTPQPTLEHLGSLLDVADLDVTAHIDLPDGLANVVQRAVYRTVQEGLTNVRKHAPGARVEVTARVDAASTVVLRVHNSAPTEPPAAHTATAKLGHLGLSERAHLLRGSFRSRAHEDGSYEIELRLPLSGSSRP